MLPLISYLNQQSNIHASLLNSIISLITDLLIDNSSNQEEILDYQGFQILGYLLQKLYNQFNTFTSIFFCNFQ